MCGLRLFHFLKPRKSCPMYFGNIFVLEPYFGNMHGKLHICSFHFIFKLIVFKEIKLQGNQESVRNICAKALILSYKLSTNSSLSVLLPLEII